MSEHVPFLLPPRDPAGHKGTFGTVAVIGGCDRGGLTMLGAPVLAARGALRSGAGLCRLGVPRSLVVPSLISMPSCTGIAFDGAAPDVFPDSDAAVLGPGLGPDPESDRPIYKLIKRIDRPTVIDADGLNALAGGITTGRRAPDLSRCVLTPHPEEFRRIARSLRLDADPIDAESRRSAAAMLSARTGAVVVLKGAGTVVADGGRVWVCDRGHHCLGTGGSGDVLAGLLGGLLAQSAAGRWSADVFDLSVIAVRAHALAGERWAASRGAEAGLLAAELADELPALLRPAGPGV